MPLKAATGPSVVPYQHPNQPLPRPAPTTEEKTLDEIQSQYLCYYTIHLDGMQMKKSGLNPCLRKIFKDRKGSYSFPPELYRR